MQGTQRSTTSHVAFHADATLVASGPPLDYSFKELRTCAEIETEDPRSGARRASPEPPKEVPAEHQEDAEALAGTGGATGSGAAPPPSAGGGGGKALVMAAGKPIKRIVRQVTTSIKLNNNMLENVVGLLQSLETVMSSPLINLQWIDLSFNQLVTIEPELLQFLNLKALYLHGNCIKALAAVDRLKKLPKLLSLTLNGNPIESTRIYRMYVVGTLQSLRSLDHSHITFDEVQAASAWYKGHLERAKKRAEDGKYAPDPDD